MIIFSQHALVKLRHRTINKNLVIRTLNKPDDMVSAYGDRKIAFKKFKKLYLKVVFRKEDKNIIVITQHWVKK